MLGIDEAGRGPVLGPMVYGIAFCPISYEPALRDMGLDDSKVLTDQTRQRLLHEMLQTTPNKDNVGFAVRVLAPQDISAAMLRANPYNLNAQSHDAAILLIRQALRAGVDIAKVRFPT